MLGDAHLSTGGAEAGLQIKGQSELYSQTPSPINQSINQS
jgi:hypothetical protein